METLTAEDVENMQIAPGIQVICGETSYRSRQILGILAEGGIVLYGYLGYQMGSHKEFPAVIEQQLLDSILTNPDAFQKDGAEFFVPYSVEQLLVRVPGSSQKSRVFVCYETHRTQQSQNRH